MAKETKIGLLVGLAFIICFSVILTNRGRQETVSAQYLDSSLLERAWSASDTSRTASPPSSPTVAADHRVRTSPPTTVGSPQPTLPHGHASAKPGVVGAAENKPPVPRAASSPEMQSGGGAVAQNPSLSGLSSTTTHHAPTEFSPSPPRREQLMRELQNATHQVPREQVAVPKAPAPAAGSPEQSALKTQTPRLEAESDSRVARYTVVPKDTLSKIAHQFYSTRSSAVVDAIFNANRAVMEQPDALRVGVQIVLPVIPGFDGPHGGKEPDPPAPIRPSATPEPERSAEPAKPAPTFRWYQVKKDDRLVSIAREQLGNASRWREIFELNKDKFPDPQRIREGVRIKLPVNENG